MKLSDYQKNFTNFVFDTCSSDQATQLSDYLNYADRLMLHKDGHSSFLADVIVDFFPRMKSILKDDMTTLAAEFVEVEKPSHYNLAVVVELFCDFFKNHWGAKDYPALLDVCLFEGLEYKCYHEQSPQSINPSEFVAKLQLKDCKVKTQDHLQLFKSDYDLDQLFHKSLKSLDELAECSAPSFFCIYQQGLTTRYKKISKPFYFLLNTCSNKNFSDVCEEMQAQYGADYDLQKDLMLILEHNLLSVS